MKNIYNRSFSPDHLSPQELDKYLAEGWYRLHQNMFSITHLRNYENNNVDRVWWLRFPVSEIKFNRSHRRILSKNSQFKVSIEKYNYVSELDEQLYETYKVGIKFQTNSSLHDNLYRDESDKQIFNTWTINVYDQQKLIYKGIIDLGEKAVLAKVNFYDHNYKKYSPGKFMILKTIEFMKEQGFEWYYPGYIIVDRPSLNYKLFLGKGFAQYYDPDKDYWNPYNDSILQEEEVTREEYNFIHNVVFRYWR